MKSAVFGSSAPRITDCFGLEVTIEDSGSLKLFNDYAHGLLAQSSGVRVILDAADADAEACVVNAHAAALLLARGSSRGFKAARKYVLRARACVRYANEREKLFGSAIYDWWRGESRSGLMRLVALLTQWPGDVTGALWAYQLAYNLGDAQCMHLVGETLVAASDRCAFAWGIHALALEQAGRVAEAERAARRGLELSRSDPWAQLAMARVFYARGLMAEGARFMTGCRPDWLTLNVDMRRHLHAHLALFHLLEGNVSQALRIFDSQIAGVCPGSARQHIETISFLWRLELEGHHAGDRWLAISEGIEARWHEHILPMNDLHFVYALARGGRAQACQALLGSMERKGEQDNSGLWDSVVVPAARGLVACAGGNADLGAARIAAVLPRLHLAGGSRQQGHAFERMAFAAQRLFQKAS
ncbi:MAG: hypothetical protein ABL973_13695 [Micropepsaceae bacterium]